MSTFAEEESSTKVDSQIRRFSGSAQTTSDMGGEVSRQPIGLDYNRVAALFYEDVITRLRKELLKYRAQAQFTFYIDSTGADPIFRPDEPSAVSRQFRAKMTTVVEEAGHTPEEL